MPMTSAPASRTSNFADNRMTMKRAAVLLSMGLLCPTIASAEVVGGSLRLGHGRLLPSTAALLGLIGVVIGRRALRHSAARGGGGWAPAGAIAAMAMGLIVLAIGALHTIFSAGGFGTGNGLAGAIVAMAMGLVSLVLGGLAVARTRATS
jgi:uncharacterized protein DUF6223